MKKTRSLFELLFRRAMNNEGEMLFRARLSRKLTACLCLALLIFLAVLPVQPVSGQAPARVLGVECSRVRALGIDKQLNMRAGLIMIGCGLVKGGQPGTARLGPRPLLAGTNINTITGPETYPKVTQSESMVWSSDGQTIVVTYNDSRDSPTNFSGVSVSTNGGASFTRLLPSPFATGHGTNFGDPVVVFNAALGLWFGGDLVSGPDCGAQGLGLWVSLDGLTWSSGACAHVGTNDDRESMWVDNNPFSPLYGRMYISYNDFDSGGQLFVIFSDDGFVWSPPIQLSPGFIGNGQITGSPDADGAVFVAAMDFGGGGFNNRQNLMYRSTDGGITWDQIVMGPPFAPPGDSLCDNPNFARISPIWRHSGEGQPGVGSGGVVHYVYAGKGINAGDTGDIYYTRSTDNGTTWSPPIVLNTDQATGGTRAQWMPSLSVTAARKVQVSWYDRRNTTDGQNYEIWGRVSLDNGAAWGPDFRISNVLIPQPEQPDPTVQACYAGDYNYVTAFEDVNYVTWTDGRVPIAGHFQQDVFFTQFSSPQASFRAYVTNNGSNTVSVIATASNTVVATVPVGSGPIGVAITPDGAFAYVANHGSNTVSVIATASNTVVATVPVGTSPEGVAITPDGAFAYVTNHASNTVSVIDTVSNTVVANVPVGTHPAGVAITPDGAFAYVANFISQTVSVIATASNTVVATVPVDGEPRGVAITPTDGALAYVTKLFPDKVSVIATASNTVVATVQVGPNPEGVAITPDGAFAYVANHGSNNVSVINTASNTDVASVTVGNFPFGVAITPDGAFAYVTNHASNTVSVIAIATNTVVATVPVGIGPWGVAITPF